MLKAIVFDFDGVIIDSEPLHYRAINEVASTFGSAFGYDRYLRELVGFDDRDAFTYLLKETGKDAEPRRVAGLCAQKQAVFERLAAQGEPIPGAVELIDQAHAAGLPLAISSGATRRDIELMLGGLGRLDRFTAIVTADDVARSKPDPASYRLAAEQLALRLPDSRIAPGNCLAIEDTAAGIASARAAGCQTLGLTTTTDAPALADAQRVVESLAGVTVDTLRRWYDDDLPTAAGG